jgi:hypothetical protein
MHAVFVAEGEPREEIANRDQAGAGQVGLAPGPDAR